MYCILHSSLYITVWCKPLSECTYRVHKKETEHYFGTHFWWTENSDLTNVWLFKCLFFLTIMRCTQLCMFFCGPYMSQWGMFLLMRRPLEQQTWVQFCVRCGSFFRISHTSDLKIGTPVTAVPGAWHYRVSVGTGWPGVSILWLYETKFDQQLLSQCGSMCNCLCRSAPEIHWRVAGTLSSQKASKFYVVCS